MFFIKIKIRVYYSRKIFRRNFEKMFINVMDDNNCSKLDNILMELLWS